MRAVGHDLTDLVISEVTLLGQKVYTISLVTDKFWSILNALVHHFLFIHPTNNFASAENRLGIDWA